MNDPQRLLLGDIDERERALLRAAADEEPSAAALGRLQRTLGLTVDPVPLAASQDHAPAFGGPPAAAGSATPGASVLASKWLLLGSAGVALVGALTWSRFVTPAVPRARPPAESVGTHAPAEPLPSAAESSALPADQSPAPRREAVADAPALRDELARLERARTALRDRRSGLALSTLDDYDRAHPHGALREEAQALRIETLFALGEVARGNDLAQSFLRSYPHSVHGARVSSQLEPRGAH
jgi:hypothetical protein